MIFHPPNGGNRNIVTAVRLKSLGVIKGVPDVMMPVSNNVNSGLAIEFKRPNGAKATPEQVNFMRLLSEQGWLVAIHTDAAEAVKEVQNYLQNATLAQNNFV